MKKLATFSLVGASLKPLEKSSGMGSFLANLNKFNPGAMLGRSGAELAGRLYGRKNPKPYESDVAPHPSAQVPTAPPRSGGFDMDTFRRNTRIGIGNYGADRDNSKLPIFGR